MFHCAFRGEGEEKKDNSNTFITSNSVIDLYGVIPTPLSARSASQPVLTGTGASATSIASNESSLSAREAHRRRVQASLAPIIPDSPWELGLADSDSEAEDGLIQEGDDDEGAAPLRGREDEKKAASGSVSRRVAGGYARAKPQPPGGTPPPIKKRAAKGSLKSRGKRSGKK